MFIQPRIRLKSRRLLRRRASHLLCRFWLWGFYGLGLLTLGFRALGFWVLGFRVLGFGIMQRLAPICGTVRVDLKSDEQEHRTTTTITQNTDQEVVHALYKNHR